MDTQTQAQLYLADQRGCSQVDYFQSFHGFNVGQYADESRQPFGTLQLVNDDRLKAGHNVCMQVEHHTDVLILPVSGSLKYTSSAGSGFLEPGQVQILSLTPGMTYDISNPYETEWVNYLILCLTRSADDFVSKCELQTFDLTNKNQLLALNPETKPAQNPSFRSFIGRYEGRQQDTYRIPSGQTDVGLRGVYVFVLGGAFEVQDRLLHERDSLALTNVKDNQVEFEALTNEALLLMIEVPLNPVY